jgi:hypothetical protein
MAVGLRNLCTPAYLYLVISIIALIIIAIQNAGNTNVYCLGEFECDVTSVSMIFLMKIIYILFWTWVLNLFCSAGATWFSWLLVLLPFLTFFILLGIMMLV